MKVSPPLDFMDRLAAIRVFCFLAAQALFGGWPNAPIDEALLLSAFGDVLASNFGTVLFRPEADHGHHRLDTALFLFLQSAMLFGGSMVLNNRERGKAEGLGLFYLRLGLPGLNMQVNRIAADAGYGESVHETEHHNHLPEMLEKRRSGTANGKNIQVRADVVATALVQFDAFAAEVELAGVLSRTEYEAILWLLLATTDARHVTRCAAANSKAAAE